MELRYPLRLTPIPIARRWGGRQIGAYLGQDLPPGRIGELIQASDETRVAGGPLDRQPLGALARRFGAALLGRGWDGAAGFPLVVRFLDAPHWAPIHVHLSPPGSPVVGAELWHLLAAHAGSGACLGLIGPFTPGARSVADAVKRRDVRPGETILIPPGLVHALGGGALAYALQAPGARTIVLGHEAADEGEPPTEAELRGLNPSLRPLDGRATEPVATLPGGRGLAHWPGVVRLERAGLLQPHAEVYDPSAGATAALYTPIAGQMTLTATEGAVYLARGKTALVPATAGAVTIAPTGELGVCTLLKAVMEAPIDRAPAPSPGRKRPG